MLSVVLPAHKTQSSHRRTNLSVPGIKKHQKIAVLGHPPRHGHPQPPGALQETFAEVGLSHLPKSIWRRSFVSREDFPSRYHADSNVDVLFFSRDKAQEIGGARWVERAAAAAEVTGQIKGLWKLLNKGLRQGLGLGLAG